MTTDDDYQRAFDSVAEAIRRARELLSKRDPKTYPLAREKRAMERQLREAGYTQADAKATVSRTFKIRKLEKL